MPNGVQVLKALRDKRNEIIDFTYVFVNAAAENFAGKKITGKKLSSLFKGENKHPFFEKLVNVVNTGAPENFVHNFEDGIQKWFHYTINRFSDGVLITQEDITERQEAKLKAEKKEEQFYSVGAEEVLGQFNASLEHQVIERTKELRENNALLQNFKRIIDTAHDSVMSVDTDVNVTYWNPASRNAYGYTVQEVTGKQLQNFIIPTEKKQELAHILNKVHQKGEFLTDLITKRVTKDGRLLDVLLSVFPLKDETGRIIGSCGIARDITEQLAAEEELKKQNSILKEAEELAQMGSWEYNIHTKEFIWSEGMYELFNLKKDTPVTPSIYLELAKEDDQDIAQKIVSDIENSTGPFEQALHIKSNGKIKIFKIKATVIRDNEEKPVRVLGVDIDATVVVEAEEKIKELNKTLSVKNRELEAANSELRTFNSIASSDYKGTLKNLYTLFEFILTNDAPRLSNSGRANLRRAQSSIQKMKLLTEDIISYSQIQIVEKDISTTVDLNMILDAVRQKMHSKIKETGANIKSAKLLIIKGYANLVELMFYHLLDNAIKFRKEDTIPLIHIIVSQVNGSYINHADALCDTWYNIISISDNGIGFEQKQVEKIFTMFSRLQEKNKYKGSGIGLPICKKIMNIHDGFITVESAPDKGTTFNCLFLLEGPLSSISIHR